MSLQAPEQRPRRSQFVKHFANINLGVQPRLPYPRIESRLNQRKFSTRSDGQQNQVSCGETLSREDEPNLQWLHQMPLFPGGYILDQETPVFVIVIAIPRSSRDHSINFQLASDDTRLQSNLYAKAKFFPNVKADTKQLCSLSKLRTAWFNRKRRSRGDLW